MKKNRPGVLLTVLTDKEHEEKLVDIILTERPLWESERPPPKDMFLKGK